MSQKKTSLLIPRETPRLEQTIRAQCFKERNLLDFIPWKTLSSEQLLQKVAEMLQKPDVFQEAMSRFKMTGFEVMHQCIQGFRK